MLRPTDKLALDTKNYTLPISLLFTKVLDLAPSSQLEEDEPTPFTTISFILPGVQRLAGIFNAPLQLFRRGAFFEKVSQLKKGVETV